MILVDIKDDQVQMNLSNMQRFAKTAPLKRLMDIGYELLRLSQRQVPHDTGMLQNSGNVETVGDDVVVGYHRPYAARLHEHPEYRFQRGRKGKYLEDPLRENLDVFAKHLGNDFAADLRAVIK